MKFTNEERDLLEKHGDILNMQVTKYLEENIINNKDIENYNKFSFIVSIVTSIAMTVANGFGVESDRDKAAVIISTAVMNHIHSMSKSMSDAEIIIKHNKEN